LLERETLVIKLSGLMVIVAAAVLAATNPGLDAHKRVVCESVGTARTNSEVLGKIAADMLGDTKAVPLQYNNYYVFSTTTLNSRTASVGVFSHVWKMK
jgi:hypothetical protein